MKWSPDLFSICKGGGELTGLHQAELDNVLEVGGQGLTAHAQQQPLRLLLHLTRWGTGTRMTVMSAVPVLLHYFRLHNITSCSVVEPGF